MCKFLLVMRPSQPVKRLKTDNITYESNPSDAHKEEQQKFVSKENKNCTFEDV